MKNTNSLRCFILLVVVLFLGGCKTSEQRKAERTEKFGFHFKGKRQKYAKIPFELSSNLMVVKVSIDESDTLNFILDTGVTSTIITDPEIANKIGLNYVRDVLVSGAGEGDPIVASISVGHTLRLANEIVARGQNIVVINDDILNLSQYLGIPVHGIFGHDIFAAFVVTMDFENKMLYISSPKSFKFKRRHGKKYPIVVTQSKPYTEAISLVSNGKSQPMKLVIDTGARHALMLNATGSQEIVSLPEKVIRANLGRGLNGDINGHLGRVNKIKLGNIEIENILASFPDSISFSMKFPPTDYDRQGSIGCELLRRFRVTLNYQENYMALKPVRIRIKESFEHDMSGLGIRAEGEGLNRYFIKSVDNYSPAALAGVREHDELVFLNDRSVSNMKISDIARVLSQKEGKSIEVFVRRDGTLQFFYFTLKRFI
jgi:predicted aspartyl protease